MNDIRNLRFTKSTQGWVKRSIAVNGGAGSSAYFHLWKGWSPPYPETTGYLIPTLFDLAHQTQKEEWRELAFSCADWLCSIQLPGGAFPGGVGGRLPPIVFDTGQIVFGLTRGCTESSQQKYFSELAKAVEWLFSQLDADGSWRRAGYVDDYSPAYNARLIWAILEANKILNKQGYRERMRSVLQHYTTFLTPELHLKNAGFRPAEAATTHTIAYYLRGLLEASLLLGEVTIFEKVVAVADHLLKQFEGEESLAGSYNESWRGNHGFLCVTGHAQLSLFFYRLFESTESQKYLQTSLQLFSTIKNAPTQIPINGMKGGITGSLPIWGPYQPFRWINWGAKFYLDAALKLGGHLPCNTSSQLRGS